MPFSSSGLLEMRNRTLTRVFESKNSSQSKFFKSLCAIQWWIWIGLLVCKRDLKPISWRTFHEYQGDQRLTETSKVDLIRSVTSTKYSERDINLQISLNIPASFSFFSLSASAADGVSLGSAAGSLQYIRIEMLLLKAFQTHSMLVRYRNHQHLSP